MKSHRERLIEAGLFQPLSPEAVFQREYILERIAQGEKIGEKPIWCIFRRDEWDRHVSTTYGKECRSAELIQDKLYHYEAQVKVDRLNNRDPEQPGRQGAYLGMYGICTMPEWADWEDWHAQIGMEEVCSNG